MGALLTQNDFFMACLRSISLVLADIVKLYVLVCLYWFSLLLLTSANISIFVLTKRFFLWNSRLIHFCLVMRVTALQFNSNLQLAMPIAV